MYINIKVGKLAVLSGNEHHDDNAGLDMLTKVTYNNYNPHHKVSDHLILFSSACCLQIYTLTYNLE